ncbi:MAG TPA: AAA domain-containing protein [Pirellulales bacterium]
MNGFIDFFHDRQLAGGFSTEDALAALLPLARQVVETHQRGQVAPLAGLDALRVEEGRLWFPDDLALPPRNNLAAVRDLKPPAGRAVEILGEIRHTADLDDGREQFIDLSIGQRGETLSRPVYLPGYVSFEHELGHHDPLTDVYSLGLLLAALACGLDLNVPEELQTFVAGRDNLFAINAALHPVLARAIVRMTELDRHRRPQDLPALVRSLENYRDQAVELTFDPALAEGFGRRDLRGRRQLVLGRLRERLFDLSRQNRLLHFRATAHTVNLTHASVPLSFDVRHIRPDQILVWNDEFARGISSGEAVSLNKYLNFSEAIYLPSVLDGIRLEARRDQTEFGFAQLRLVICFLRWADLKQSPPARYDSPLVLLPVELTLRKGVRDTFWIQATTNEAEVNPVVRHQFKQLYDVDLPETIDLAQTDLKTFYEFLSSQVQASESAVHVKLIERPRIRLIHERAQRRLDLYRRRQRLAGRGVRSFLNLDYSYDANNYHPLGLRLFNERIRPPGTRLRTVLEGASRPRHYFDSMMEDGPPGPSSNKSEPIADTSATERDGLGRPSSDGQSSDGQSSDGPSPDGQSSAPAVDEKERLLYALEGETETNPYTWEFDLCSVTLGNFRYRKMSLVRDYSALLEQEAPNPAFDAIFSLSPREVALDEPPPPPLEDRYDVVACDPTQAGAIALARGGRSYVIQGPPGTGKSQTITNLIADYVAQGRRVLFVCEKRAAIDVVFLRLREQGLDELCSLIHDSQSDKKQFVMELKNCYESLLAESGKRRQNREKKREATLKLLREHLAPLERFGQAMCGVPERAGVPLRSLLERLIELREVTPALDARQLERVPYYAAWSSARGPLKRISNTLAEMRGDGVLARHPLRRLHVSLADAERPIDQVSAGLRLTQAALDEVEAALGKARLPAELANTVDKARQLVEYAQLVEPLARLGQMPLLDASGPRAKLLAKLLKQYRSADTTYRKAQEAARGWTQKLPPADVSTALAQARRLEQTPLAFLKLDWWRLRSIIRRSYNFRAHAVRPSWVQLLELLEKEYQTAAKAADVAGQVRQEFGYEGTPHELAELVEELRGASEQVSGVVGRLRDRLLKPAAKQDEVAALVAARPALDGFQRELDAIVMDAHRREFATLRGELAEMEGALGDLPDFVSCLSALAELPAEIAEAARELPFDHTQLEAAAARRSLEDAYRGDRGIAKFTTAARDEHARQLDEACRDWRETNADVVRQRVRQSFFEHVAVASQSAAQLSAEEKEFKKSYNAGRRELEHEFGKSMRFKSIRDLVAGPSGQVIRDLKPVWLMSPLSVSDTLPLDEQVFDVVIFDEASQITVEEAVPAIFRARQAIVVGDEMQLPPSDFFSARGDHDDADRLLVEEGDEVVSYDLDSGSFLNHAVRNLAARMLGWHYRSRSESLISFSNRAFYQGKLLTVPEERLAGAVRGELKAASAEDAEGYVDGLLDRPISFHWLEHGRYENRRNQPEAEYIARLVRELLRRETGLSLGVIAFSEAQQDEISGALTELARDDADFRRRLEAEYEREDDGQFQGLLVKNLENIQGDERDVVIQSVCYGRGPGGKMLMNFGPINRSGGEKRLNVAFSRAKHHMVLVSSIVAADITNDYNDGAACLKNYLRYAAAVSAGDAESANRVLADLSDWRGDEAAGDSARADAVPAQLAAALEARGWLVDRSVGQSHFRCDLAVRAADDAAYRLGILIDTAAWYSQPDVLERELMKPKLLGAFGWRVAHVLTKEWHEDRDRVLSRLEQLLRRAN